MENSVMNIIYNDGMGENTATISNIAKLYSNCTKAIIFGKSPSFQIIKEKQPEQFFVCVNETINHIDNCDLLVCNDIDAFDKIDLHQLKNLKNILIPYHIHINSSFNQNVTYNNVITKIKDYFHGNLIIYNLRTANKEHTEHITLQSTMTSAHTGFEFMGRNLPQIKLVDFYGVLKGTGYHELFKCNTQVSNLHTSQTNISHIILNDLSKTLHLDYVLH